MTRDEKLRALADSREGDPDCDHRWLELMFGERECADCGLVEW